jgi:uncharacterized protein YjiS (DUF1127 family)
MAAVIQRSLTNFQPVAVPSSTGVNRPGALASIARLIQLWRSRIRERRTFVTFDHRDLRDIGLSRWDLERELSKPFWRG